MVVDVLSPFLVGTRGRVCRISSSTGHRWGSGCACRKCIDLLYPKGNASYRGSRYYYYKSALGAEAQTQFLCCPESTVRPFGRGLCRGPTVLGRDPGGKGWVYPVPC